MKNKFYLSGLLLLCFNGWAEQELDCDKVWTTADINRCLIMELGQKERQMDKYLQASLKRVSGDSQTLSALKNSQMLWEAYRDGYCDAVYSRWRDGSVRGAMGIDCRISLTMQRTRTLWSDFLTHMDSTPPLLPEPDITRR